MRVSDIVQDTIFGLLDKYLATPEALTTGVVDSLSQEIVADLVAVLGDSRISYRDGVMIQLAYGLTDQAFDLTKRQSGARSVAQNLGVFLAERHIRSVKDAYQNIAKNTDVLTRGNVNEFDRILRWANSANLDERKIALNYVCAEVASTARPVLKMPPLNRSILTYSRIVNFLYRLLSTPSGGAFEQFAVAAFLNTLVANHGEGRARIETKNLNASDRSSYVAGDVQLVLGSRIIDAFEVTSSNWSAKIPNISKSIRDNDLSRMHILSDRPESDRKIVVSELMKLKEDVSVLDVMQFLEVIVAVLTRPQRAEALIRFYEYLDRYQPSTDRVNQFVNRIGEEGLVERAGD